MKTLRYAIPTVIFVLLFIPSAIFAQDASAEPIDVTSALDVIRTEYGEDILILEAEYDSKDDENETTCWEIEFEVTNADATITNMETHVCRGAETSNLVIVLDEDENGDDDNDSDDNDEQAFSAPTISIDEAIATTLETVADGVITSIELENDASVLVWVFELEASPNVYISADSGDVIEFADSDDDDSDDDHDDDDDDDSDENHDDDDEDSNEDHDDEDSNEDHDDDDDDDSDDD